MLNEDQAFEELMDFFSEENINKMNKEIEEGTFSLEENQKQEPIIVFEKTREQELEDLKQEGFNEQQLKVIQSNYPIVNIAGPGSGKTKTLIEKIIVEVREINDLKNLLVLTFTNAASNEILERLGKKFNVELDRRDYYSGTYHGIFYKLMKENHEKLKLFGFTNSPKILDDNENKHLFESIVYTILDKESKLKKKAIKENFEQEHGFMPIEIYYQINNIINAIPKSIKDIKERVKEHSKSNNENELKNIENIVHQFFKFKIENNLFGFSDILMYMNFLLEKDKDFKETLQNKFKHILIDEYQDTNPIQAKILNELDNSNNSCIIGDPYQSIYRFLGASVKNIMNKAKLDGMNTIQLVKNYRSTPNIVAFTNDIAKQFNERIQNHIPCESAALGLNNMKVFLKEKISQEFNIVREIKQRLEKGISLDEMAVLVRTNFETYKLEAALKREKIPFIKLGGNELYETKEVKIMIDLAKVLSNEYTLKNFENIADYYKGLGEVTIEKLKNLYLTSEHQANKNIIDFIDEIPTNTKGIKIDNLKEFKNIIFGNITKKDMENLFFEQKESDIIRNFSFESFEAIMKELDIEETLLKDVDTSLKKKELQNNINYFKEELKTYFEKGKEELIEFLGDISLGQNDIPNEKDKSNVLTLSTIHGAKGKEWKDVYVMNVQEGIFPSARHKSEKITEQEREALLEEEKRLLYVAVSRAKEKLMLLSENELNDLVQPLINKPYVNHYKGNR